MASDKWQHVTPTKPCPVCGRPNPHHRSRWCSTSVDGDVAICMFVSSNRPVRSGGWLHRLRPWSSPPKAVRQPPPVPRAPIDLALAVRQWVRSAGPRLAGLARDLGIPAQALRDLDVGWDGEAWTWPMRDDEGRIIGVRRRLMNGRKLSVRGGREGLFLPAGWERWRYPSTICVCEGPTDTAAVRSLGLLAIGRPSNVGGHDLLVSVLRELRPAELIVLADRDQVDTAGDLATWRAAWRLAAEAEQYRITARVRRPPVGCKDARDWVRAGASAESIIGV